MCSNTLRHTWKKENSSFDTLILSIKKDGTILPVMNRLIILIYLIAKRGNQELYFFNIKLQTPDNSTDGTRGFLKSDLHVHT